MSRRSSLALFALVCLAALPAAAAAQHSSSTFRGDGFDATLYSYDGCRDVQVYVSGSDYATKAGPGQPQTTNYLSGYAYVFDCETQASGYAYIDQTNAMIDAKGPNGASTLRGSFEVRFEHWEPSGEQYCYSYGGWCWTDWEGNEVCEPESEYCYDEYVLVVDPSKTLELDLSLAPNGDTYRGMNMNTQKGPGSMYRYRYSGSQRYGSVEGTMTIDGEDFMGTAYSYSWASVWTASSGSMSIYSF